MKITTGMRDSRFGNPEPFAKVGIFDDARGRRTGRALRAALYRIAAEVEERTPDDEAWTVSIVVLCDAIGRVSLEVADADQAAAGLDVLRAAVASFEAKAAPPPPSSGPAPGAVADALEGVLSNPSIFDRPVEFSARLALQCHGDAATYVAALAEIAREARSGDKYEHVATRAVAALRIRAAKGASK